METLDELKVIIGRAFNFPVNYYATSGNCEFYFSDGPDVDGCVMFMVGECGDLIEIDTDNVCLYGFNTFRSLPDIKLIIELKERQKKSYESYVALEKVKQRYNGENKIAKEMLNFAYSCGISALPSQFRQEIKKFLGKS